MPRKKQSVPEKAKIFIARGRHLRITYTLTKSRQNRAYYNTRIGDRWLPIPLKDAEYMLKHGKADYIKKSDRMPVYRAN